MGHREQPDLPSAVKNSPKLGRRMSNFRRVEANAQDPFAVLHGVGQGLHRGIGAEVAEKAQDQPATDVEPATSILERPVDASDHGFEWHATVRMRLRIEEDLGMAHALAGGPGQVGPCEVVEVLFLEQHAAARVIDVEEGLQIAENISMADVLDRGIRQGNGVSARQLEHQLRLECPLDVKMELGLW